ncbi:hypothetical protein NSK_008324 [Nannochloropsis salina CCMP1776]|uniref:Uncharacterized protein n=1 Tax=Nannochloropsis salina CCMP1776 TaxID=1027361 RepID=A0A4D9CUH4_9STRA|nr:hypothetical protein NSK_008324 [Nannochloropsis salina CCMP1776]|eukprot:TFJ80319.1 hypothetical protein NSK_008324 [Nannochloropsis salina CCMP1776]
MFKGPYLDHKSVYLLMENENSNSSISSASSGLLSSAGSPRRSLFIDFRKGGEAQVLDKITHAPQRWQRHRPPLTSLQPSLLNSKQGEPPRDSLKKSTTTQSAACHVIQAQEEKKKSNTLLTIKPWDRRWGKVTSGASSFSFPSLAAGKEGEVGGCTGRRKRRHQEKQEAEGDGEEEPSPVSGNDEAFPGGEAEEEEEEEEEEVWGRGGSAYGPASKKPSLTSICEEERGGGGEDLEELVVRRKEEDEEEEGRGAGSSGGEGEEEHESMRLWGDEEEGESN